VQGWETPAKTSNLNFNLLHTQIKNPGTKKYSSEPISLPAAKAVIKYLRIKLNYGEFVHSEPLFCLYAEQPEQFSADTGGEKCFFFYKDMQAQDGLTEEEFLNMTADELEARTKG
jgi:hypothetical protein